MKNLFYIEPEAEELFIHSLMDVYLSAKSHEDSTAKLRAREADLKTDDLDRLLREDVYQEYCTSGSRLIRSIRDCGPEIASFIWGIAKLGEAELSNGISSGNIDIIDDNSLFIMIDFVPHMRFVPQSVAQLSLFVRQIVSIKNLADALLKGTELACDTGLLSNGACGIFHSWGVLNG